MYLVKTPPLLKTIYPTLIWHINTKQKELYLTFDDGPTPGVTNWVLDVLKEYQAKATFFCLGINISKNKQLFEKILHDGHQVGNHTNRHLNGWFTPSKSYLKDAEDCQKHYDFKLFRPPYGKIKPTQIALLKKQYKIVMWDVLSADFDTNVDAEKCIENVLENVQPGSIVVFHDSNKAFERLKKALPKILKELSGQGYVFKSILP
jgi:peptidoglycan/xylan/chitin deacetylase (PgdA/CDA1 family)